jgi:3-oxoacyl-[acyl-carrier-protein] synthase-3
MRAIISGIGHHVPDKRLTNSDLEQMVATSDEWITSRTGIKERRILEDDKATSHMAVAAAQKALEQAQTDPDQIDLIILATVTPDKLVPSGAAIVQAKLNAVNSWGFDLNGGCSGFIYALATASQFIVTGHHQRVLVIGADKMSAIINYEDRDTCVLFGDGAGAVVLAPNDNPNLGIEDFIMRTDGHGESALHIPAGGSRLPASDNTVATGQHYIRQTGKVVFKAAVSRMTEISRQLLARNKLDSQDIDLFVPHQANHRIIEAVADKLGIEPPKVVENIASYGNTTAATIPLAMSEIYQAGRLKKGNRIIMAAFGAGFTWGGLLLRWAYD